MHTDASHRYERGVDFQLQVAAIERATRLLLDIVGGEPGPVVLACSDEHLPALEPIQLRADRNAAYHHVAETLADASRAGLARIGFVSEPEP